LRVSRDDGRTLEVLVYGRISDRPLIFHGGTPSAAVPYPPMAAAAAQAELRFVTYSRPGYAGSSPSPGRSVADAAADVAALADAIEADTFVTAGWSGGGPHALALAALLPGRCLAAATIAGVAPYPAPGLDWLEGMAAENVEEFSAAIQGVEALTPLLSRFAEELAGVQGKDVATALGGLVSEVDKASLGEEFAEYLAASFRQAVSTGVAGWRDDDLAFVKPWGFQLGEIQRPVAVWQGGQDRMVPFAHGGWLAEHIPGARVHLQPGDGHLSLTVGSIGEILRDLSSLARQQA
jgi:pimeloyl-ACP methyl ester carboxylesterase